MSIGLLCGAGMVGLPIEKTMRGLNICAWWLMVPYITCKYFNLDRCLIIYLFQRTLVLTGIKLLANFLFGSVIFTSALIMAFIHTWSQDNRGKQVHFYVVQIRAEWLPFALLGVNFVMAGPNAAMIEGTGILASHLYDFLTRIWPTFGGGRNYITTPAFVHNLFDDSRSSSRGYGAAYRPAQAGQAGQAGQSSGSSSSYFGSSWSTRGAGRRLGN